MKHKIIFIVLLALLGLGLPCVAKERGFFSQMKRMLFPPEDLFELVTQMEIDPATVGDNHETQLRIKYDGPYNFGIMMEKYESSIPDAFRTKQYALTTRLQIELLEGTNLLHSVKTTDDYSPFIGLRGNGLMLGTFETPDDVPNKKNITCKVSVLSSDEVLPKQYGTVTFYIQKASEK